MSSVPISEAEIELYRVMEKANLLAYYDTLIEMGGDDVQQLCDAGEAEFLEIMSLVGMASKPLHVRRLQKVLLEYVKHPEEFKTPLIQPGLNSSCSGLLSPAINHQAMSTAQPPLSPAVPTVPVAVAPPSPLPIVIPVCAIDVPRPKSSPVPNQMTPENSGCTSTSPGPSPGSPLQLTPVLNDTQISRIAERARILVNIKNIPKFQPKPHNAKKKICRDLETVMLMPDDDPRRMDEIRKYAAIYGRFDCKRKPEKPLTLHEVSVNEAAAQICCFAPALLTRRDELFPLARQVVRDCGYHYSKPNTSLASLRTYSQQGCRNGDDGNASKRSRLDVSEPWDTERVRRQERLEAIADELRSLGDRTEELVTAAQQVREKNDLSAVHSLQQQMETVQNKQTQLLMEQSELLKQPLPPRIYRRNSVNKQSCALNEDKADTDDTDSQMSFSNASSPLQEVGDSRESLADAAGTVNQNGSGKSSSLSGKQVGSDSADEDETVRYTKNIRGSFDSFYSDGKVKVISASGNNIIAVANPALSMSSILPSSDVTKLPDIPLALNVDRQLVHTD